MFIALRPVAPRAVPLPVSAATTGARAQPSALAAPLLVRAMSQSSAPQASVFSRYFSSASPSVCSSATSRLLGERNTEDVPSPPASLDEIASVAGGPGFYRFVLLACLGLAGYLALFGGNSAAPSADAKPAASEEKLSEWELCARSNVFPAFPDLKAEPEQWAARLLFELNTGSQYINQACVLGYVASRVAQDEQAALTVLEAINAIPVAHIHDGFTSVLVLRGYARLFKALNEQLPGHPLLSSKKFRAYVKAIFASPDSVSRQYAAAAMLSLPSLTPEELSMVTERFTVVTKDKISRVLTAQLIVAHAAKDAPIRKEATQVLDDDAAALAAPASSGNLLWLVGGGVIGGLYGGARRMIGQLISGTSRGPILGRFTEKTVVAQAVNSAVGTIVACDYAFSFGLANPSASLLLVPVFPAVAALLRRYARYWLFPAVIATAGFASGFHTPVSHARLLVAENELRAKKGVSPRLVEPVVQSFQ